MESFETDTAETAEEADAVDPITGQNQQISSNNAATGDT